MLIRIIAFSKNGIEIIKKIGKNCKADIDVHAFAKCDDKALTEREISSEDASLCHVDKVDNLLDWVEEGFKNKAVIVFVGAMGIAVRSIAPFLKDKLTDSPVIVIDDAGRFVISILSGHVGGANKIADYLSELLDATNVVTTSTDVNSAFSVDTYAMENNLSIVNRDKIKKVSVKALEGKPVVIAVKKYPCENPDVIIEADSNTELINEDLPVATVMPSAYEEIDALIIREKKYVLGIGLKKNKDFESVEALCLEVLKNNGLSFSDIYAVSSIDVKIDEEAIKRLSYKYNLPRIFWDKDMLNSVKGEFTASEFVKDTVGVDNVCERAALLTAGKNGKLIVKKAARDGVTVAIAMLG